MKLPVLIAAVCLLAPVWLRAAPDWSPQETQLRAAQLLNDKDYAGLDALCAALRKEGYDIRQAFPELQAFYFGLRPFDDSADPYWQARDHDLDAWVTADPDSETARIARASFLITQARRASSLPPGAAHAGDDSLNKAAEVLNKLSASRIIDDPVYYTCMLQLSTTLGRPRAEILGWLKKSIELAPEYYPNYAFVAFYLSDHPGSNGPEREQAIKIWGDAFPGDKGGVLYAYLLSEDTSRFPDASYFDRLPVDYARARDALIKRLSGPDPGKWFDENCLAQLAAFKGENGLGRRMFLDIEDSHVYHPIFVSQERYTALRASCGAAAAMDAVSDLERAGKLNEAEAGLRSFTSDAANYWPLYSFYERQGMAEKLFGMTFLFNGATISQLARVDVAAETHSNHLAELAAYFPMTGQWDKAQAVAARLDALYPNYFVGKNTLLLCAIQRRDGQAIQNAIRAIVSSSVTEPHIRLAQSVLSGAQSWEQVSGEMMRTKDAELAHAALSIALYYLAKANIDEARKVIADALPACLDNSGKTILQSLLYGSLGRTLMPTPPGNAVAR